MSNINYQLRFDNSNNCLGVDEVGRLISHDCNDESSIAFNGNFNGLYEFPMTEKKYNQDEINLHYHEENDFRENPKYMKLEDDSKYYINVNELTKQIIYPNSHGFPLPFGTTNPSNYYSYGISNKNLEVKNKVTGKKININENNKESYKFIQTFFRNLKLLDKGHNQPEDGYFACGYIIFEQQFGKKEKFQFRYPENLLGSLPPSNTYMQDKVFKGTNLEGKVEVINGVSNWFIPATGKYKISLGGASGYGGGKGASFVWETILTKDVEL